MGMFRNLEISETGMTANRQWMQVAAENIANANTTRTPAGGPYKNKSVSFAQILETQTTDRGVPVQSPGGVKVGEIKIDNSPFTKIHNPGHPDADKNGDLLLPNVNPVVEMTNLTAAARSYEANVAAFNAGRAMFMKALEIGRGS